MKRVFIPAGGACGGLARMLLDIVGHNRAGEIDMVTRPARGFMVPEDVAVEHRRRTCPPPAPTIEPELTPTPDPKQTPLVADSEPEQTPLAPTIEPELTPTPDPEQVSAIRPTRATKRKGGVTGG